MKHQVITKLIASFITVVILVGVVTYISSNSVKRVSAKADQLIKVEIPQLNQITNTQNLMAATANHLLQYYATFDRANHLNNVPNFARLQHNIHSISAIHQDHEVSRKLEQSLQVFIDRANRLDAEMQLEEDRDWDVLRTHLYAAQAQSKIILGQLDITKKQIAERVKQGSVSTQYEVHQLNYLQLGFSVVVLITALFILFNLHSRIKDKAELYKRAYYNGLSGLPNRKYFEEHIHQILSRQQSPDLAMMMINLDRFSLITSSIGYFFGDRLVHSVSQWLIATLRQHASSFDIYHFSGTSWLVMFKHAQTEATLAQLAEQLNLISSVTLTIDDREMTCSCSIGIVQQHALTQEREALLRCLDTALREAQQAGGNCYRFYQPSMSAVAKHWIETEQALRSAIEKHQFQLYYQPKVNTQTRLIQSSEALLRWSKEGVFISPAVFIPIAEKSNLILNIGRWVLTEACSQWARWRAEGLPAMPIAVNISAQQFQEVDFPRQVQATLQRFGMPANMLELEITEEAAAHDPKRVVQIMEDLKSIGVTLAIDDFGTGYSSLSHLSNFPVDVLKIDRAFIQHMHHSSTDASIVRLVVQLAKGLNFKVVAEGVETESQYQQLKLWDCNLIQGFLFSQPLPAPQFASLVMEERQRQHVNQVA